MLTRRDMLHTLGGCACCLVASTAVGAELLTDLTPVVTRGYAPADQDERGLWQSCEQLEEMIKVSNLRIRDQAINDYLVSVMHRLLPDQADTIRVYLVRNPEFNASMAPNGMMLVHTGLLARMRNEAQLAAVLGHESGHYLRRHSLQGWRSQRAKTAAMAFIAAGANAAGGYTGSSSWYDLANAINQSLLLSIFSYDRSLESEADAYGLKLLNEAGYPPQAASEVWAQVIEERKSSAEARNKKYKDHAVSAYSTHPPNADRMQGLGATAKILRMRQGSDREHDDGRASYLAAVGPYRAALIEEQIKLNDSGASLYLISSLAQDGWDSVLKFYEGEIYRLRAEPGDVDRAAAAYKDAAAYPDAGPEAFRAHGYAQLKVGNRDEGLTALRRYLELKPDAPDAEMVRFTLEQ
jgi:beta-barrel assembly-enhancing protease